ncbi:MAG TPA: HAMP domain-containing methyl-accepting chemotaxis protein [Anaeromyxobacter sp.]|nr:HAMP domain-containing methyl-accepting chemotaxis protein [Anaeromyxobacter sp.]
MRPLASIFRRVVLAEAAVALVGVVTARGVATFERRELGLVIAGSAASLVLETLAFLLVLRARSRRIAAALGSPAPGDAVLSRQAAADVLGLPAAGSLALLLAGLFGMFLAALFAFVGRWLSPDLALASLGLGAGFALLGAMVGYALCAEGLPEILSRLRGSSESSPRGTLRGKILFLCAGLNVVAVLLVASAAYLRHREEVVAELSRAALLVEDALGERMAGRPAAEVASELEKGTGHRAAVLSSSGRVLFATGEFPAWEPGADPAKGRVDAAGALVVHAAGGFVVQSALLPSGGLAVFVPDGAVLLRVRPFALSLLLAALVTFAGTAVLVWISANVIAGPVSALGQAADRIASGDLTVSPPSVSADEMGLLAAQFRRMALGLTRLVLEVKMASEKVSTGAAEAGSIGDRVRRGALDQLQGVRQVQGALEEMEGSMSSVSRGLIGVSDYVAATSRSVIEMSEAFEEVKTKGVELERAMGTALGDMESLSAAGRDAEGRLTALESLAVRSGGTLAEVKASVAGLERAAGESETNALAVAEASERAGLVMEETVRGIETLRGAVADAHARIEALGRRSDDIDQVVDFISEVAGRTNLLSLNASIIAAQAGEHGKAFAVVADQIRDLAAQIARSTKSIGDSIRAVREDVVGSAALIDRGDALAVEGVQLARNSLDSLAEIRRSTARGRETAAGIRAAVQTHAQSSREVANLVELVAEGSRAVAAAVQLVGRSVGGSHSVSRGVTGMADRVARMLEEQAGLAKRQLENLARLEVMIKDIAKAVEAHAQATQAVKRSLEDLSRTAGQHETAVHGLSGVSDQIGSRARALSETVSRFKV